MQLLAKAEAALQCIMETEEHDERKLALDQRELALDQREFELNQRDSEQEQRDSEQEQRDSELADVRDLLVATLNQNIGLLDLVECLASEVLARPADSVTCLGIANITRKRCKCKPMSNGYCYHHQAQRPKSE